MKLSVNKKIKYIKKDLWNSEVFFLFPVNFI